MKLLTQGLLITAGLLGSFAAQAARHVEVEITNLTNGVYFTPLLVAALPEGHHLFQAGTRASDHLQAMAEGGDLTGLIADVESIGGRYVADPAGGVLAPGASATASVTAQGLSLAANRLSIVAMLLPTNDGFVGLDSVKIPLHSGVYTYYLNGYDAGTELNDEVIKGGGAPGVPGIPADPGGYGGFGATGVEIPYENPVVHVHPGVIGDMDPTGGVSDVDSRVHPWLNPVARVTVRVE